MTLAALFLLVSAADSGKPADSKRQEEAVEMYVREEKEENKEENEKRRRSAGARNRAVQTKICFGQLILQDFDQKK